MMGANVWSATRAALVATTVALGLTAFPGTAQAAGMQDVSVRLIQSSELPVTGRPMIILGDMVSGAEAIGGREVSIAITPASDSLPVKVIIATTDRQGRFEVGYRPRSTFSYVASFAGDEYYAPAESSAHQAVAAHVGITRVPKSVRAGRSFIVRGRGPALLTGVKVLVHRGVRGAVCGVGRPPSSGVLKTTKMRGDGTFSVRVRLGRAGNQPIFVQIAKSPTAAAGYTAYRTVRVRSAP